MLYPTPIRSSHIFPVAHKQYVRQTEIASVPSKSRRKVNVARVVRQALRTLPVLLFASGVVASVAFLITTGLADFRSAAAPATAQYVRVTVAQGDTLWGIASRYGSSTTDTPTFVGQIYAANPSVSEAGALKPGSVLLVPMSTGASSALANPARAVPTRKSHHHIHRSHAS